MNKPMQAGVGAGSADRPLPGATLAQMARGRFLKALEDYREAGKALLADGSADSRSAFVQASLVVHASKAGVPKSWWPLVNRARREFEGAALPQALPQEPVLEPAVARERAR